MSNKENQEKKITSDKLGLSWAKLSCQLGFGWNMITICCISLIYIQMLSIYGYGQLQAELLLSWFVRWVEITRIKVNLSWTELGWTSQLELGLAMVTSKNNFLFLATTYYPSTTLWGYQFYTKSIVHILKINLWKSCGYSYIDGSIKNC